MCSSDLLGPAPPAPPVGPGAPTLSQHPTHPPTHPPRSWAPPRLLHPWDRVHPTLSQHERPSPVDLTSVDDFNLLGPDVCLGSSSDSSGSSGPLGPNLRLGSSGSSGSSSSSIRAVSGSQDGSSSSSRGAGGQRLRPTANHPGPKAAATARRVTPKPGERAGLQGLPLFKVRWLLGVCV